MARATGPDFEAPGLAYVVEIPEKEIRLFRFVRSEAPGPDEFASNRDLGKRRRRRIEDAVDYLGISCFETFEQAVAFVRDLNQRLALARSRVQPYRHIAELAVRGRAGHAVARTGEIPGHHTVWGEPEELAATVERVVTIGTQRA